MGDGLGKGSAIGDVSSMKHPPPQQPQEEHRNSALSMECRLLPYAACFLVAVNFAQTMYRVLHDPRDLAFVLAAYAMPALLFYRIRRFEALVAAEFPRRESDEERLKLSVWALSTALTAVLSLPPVSPLSLLIIWVMALLIAIGGLCLLFVSDGGGFGSSLEKWNDEASKIEE